MEMSNSLLSVSQNFFTTDFIKKISDITGETTEKTMTGLKSVVPEFMSALIDKGATAEGATTLVDIVNTHNFESSTTPDASKLSDGNDVLKDIYGNNLNSTVSRLATSTGLNSSIITKMLGLVAPVFMGAIGTKVKSEKLSLSELMSFIKQQHKALSGFSGKTSEFYQLSGKSPDKDYKKRFSERLPWKTITWISIALLAIWFWWNITQIRVSS